MIFIMAWRNIWRNKTRSLVIMLSVAIGLLAGIGVLALYKGMMESRVRTVIDSETGHLQIHHPEFKKDYHPSFTLPGAEQLVSDIMAIPGVSTAATRTIVQGMLVTATGSSGVQVNGIIQEQEALVSRFNGKLIEGKGFADAKKNEIIIGKKLAGKMNLKTGAKLVLTFTDTSDNLVSSAFRIRSIYESGNAPLDEVNVYVPMEVLNELLAIKNSFHELTIRLKNDNDLQTAEDLLKMRYPNLLVESWREISPETELMVKTVDEYSYIIMIIVLFALAFGILNTMLMSVLERTREIGMMVALGTTRARIFMLVLLETVFLTMAGSPVGLVAGLLVTNYYSVHGVDFSGMGKDMMASFGFDTTIYPLFPWDKLTGIILLVLGTALVSCLFPAVKAFKLKPVEALRR